VFNGGCQAYQTLGSNAVGNFVEIRQNRNGCKTKRIFNIARAADAWIKLLGNDCSEKGQQGTAEGKWQCAFQNPTVQRRRGHYRCLHRSRAPWAGRRIHCQINHWLTRVDDHLPFG
jgi:hypothetical protein